MLRRLSQAEDDLDRAVEVVDFQGVGMELRECMISLMAAARRRTELPEGTEEPQAANVKAWVNSFSTTTAPVARMTK